MTHLAGKMLTGEEAAGPLKPIDPDAEVERLVAERAERPQPRRWSYPIGGLPSL